MKFALLIYRNSTSLLLQQNKDFFCAKEGFFPGQLSSSNPYARRTWTPYPAGCWRPWSVYDGVYDEI